ncbi:MAG: T9SS type A sorting domain-containing protein [Candidatus Kapabacteria bacterium]|nr:T9SS type A sorting domain-containing protein [Candidatus Kapabacteria bacterium]
MYCNYHQTKTNNFFITGNILLIFLLCFVTQLKTSAELLPTIGINKLPADSDSVCYIPWYFGNFYDSGLPADTFANDFKIYDLKGDSLVLSQKLAKGKPILLIAGSLTCPIFREKIPIINKVISIYGDKIQVYVIYVIEPHPTDTSIYYGDINIPSENKKAGILFPQPLTYGQRKHLVDTMSYWCSLKAPVFIDGPCNEWWTMFGPAPNNAYLIDTNGYIYAKHPWFHRMFNNIFCDIDSLLGTNSGLCNPSSIQQPILKTETEIYPNPASEFIIINGFSGEIRIFNLMGEIVLMENIEENKKLDISKLPAGLYSINYGDKFIRIVKI